MGGNLAWTIRQEDGTEHRMDHWTNSIPGSLHCGNFLNGDQAVIDETLSHWLGLKADWEANHETKQFKNPVTPLYAPYPFGMKPSEYGMVVVDFISKKVLSLQGYSNLGSIFASRLMTGPQAEESDRGGTESLFKAAAEGRVTEYEFVTKNKDAVRALEEMGGTSEPHIYDDEATVVSVPGSVDIQKLIALCDALFDHPPSHPHAEQIAEAKRTADKMPDGDEERRKIDLMIDGMKNWHKFEHRPFTFAVARYNFAPFELEEFEESADGYRALLKRIQELDFQLTDDELKAWDERIAYIEAKDEEGRASA